MADRIWGAASAGSNGVVWCCRGCALARVGHECRVGKGKKGAYID